MYVSGLLRCAVKRLEPMWDLTKRFRRRTVASPDMYFALSDERVQPYINAIAKKKCKVSIGEQELTYPEVLAEFERAHAATYLEMRQAMIARGTGATWHDSRAMLRRFTSAATIDRSPWVGGHFLAIRVRRTYCRTAALGWTGW